MAAHAGTSEHHRLHVVAHGPRHGYEELTKRDKVNLDIFWLKDEALEDSANLPPPKLSPRRLPTTWKLRWSNSPPSRNI